MAMQTVAWMDFWKAILMVLQTEPPTAALMVRQREYLTAVPTSTGAWRAHSTALRKAIVMASQREEPMGRLKATPMDNPMATLMVTQKVYRTVVGSETSMASWTETTTATLKATPKVHLTVALTPTGARRACSMAHQTETTTASRTETETGRMKATPMDSPMATPTVTKTARKSVPRMVTTMAY